VEIAAARAALAGCMVMFLRDTRGVRSHPIRPIWPRIREDDEASLCALDAYDKRNSLGFASKIFARNLLTAPASLTYEPPLFYEGRTGSPRGSEAWNQRCLASDTLPTNPKVANETTEC
jgi:hypothetical protein